MTWKTLLVAGAIAATATQALAQDKTEIAVSRTLGSCESEYGDVVRASEANGECGIITALINQFNDTSEQYVVREEIVEWPGYDQFTARLRAGDPPVLHVMHASALSDYQSRGLLKPLGDELEAAGIDLSDMTEAARNNVTKEGEIWALPFDVSAWLWHINTNLFEEAGLMRDGEPVLPSSPEELLEQARQFTEATGVPYLVQAESGNMQAVARNLLTFLYQQEADFFADPTELSIDSEVMQNYVDVFGTIREEGLSTRDLDYAGATQAFPNGEGGVYIMGTWLIDTYNEESKVEGHALEDGYAVKTFPQLYQSPGYWSEGHIWVMPEQELESEKKDAAIAFLKFLWDNNIEWARTGHLPVRASLIESEAFTGLPHRDDLVGVTTEARMMPAEVKRQFTMVDVFGEEAAAAYKGQKSTEEAIADVERRINDMLARAR